MSYIPLDDELKVKGKAAIEVIGGRAGKSGGSIIQQILLITVAAGAIHGQEMIAPYLFGFVALIIGMWIFAIYKLNARFSALSKAHTQKNESPLANASQKDDCKKKIV